MFKTESEAWEAIADTLEMIEGLPEGKAGLCGVVNALCHDGFITYTLNLRMHDRIAAYRVSHRKGLFLFPPRAWKPRVELARRFAAESQSEEARRV